MWRRVALLSNDVLGKSILQLRASLKFNAVEFIGRTITNQNVIREKIKIH
jgi:hypothetical protein